MWCRWVWVGRERRERGNETETGYEMEGEKIELSGCFTSVFSI